MTTRELDAQAKRLAESQEKFVSTLYMLFEVLEGFQDYLTSLRGSFELQRQVMDAQSEEFKTTLNAFHALIKAFSESNVTVKENSEKLDQVIAKMESYFGSGAGLEYDN
jgi:uncharacterized protein YhaN